MPAKTLFFIILSLTFQAHAAEDSLEADMELFEFLATFDQQDADYLDEEINNEQGLVSNNVVKGETDE